MRKRRIAIVGGGMSGLSAAHRLAEIDPHAAVTLHESSPRLGGSLQTETADGYLIEQGGDMFTTREPWALDLCRRIGLADELIETDPRFRRAFIVHRGKLVPVPEGFTLMTPTRVWPVLTTPLLSWRGKLRLACEWFVPRRRDGCDESLAQFTQRRFGREAFERLVQPLIGGIYTADPTKLSVRSALPQFVEMERSAGSLIRAMRHSAPSAPRESGARYGSFLAPRRGLGSLVKTLADRLVTSDIRLNSRIERVELVADTVWRLVSADGQAHEYDGLIVATAAPVAGRLLRPAALRLADELDAIEYAGAAVVVFGFHRDQLSHPLDGFGCVVPMIEDRRILSVSFASIKFAGRAPPDAVLLRTFVGGACQEQLVEWDDQALFQLVAEELQELLGIRGVPQLKRVFRWRQAMPQYHVGHSARVERIERLAGELPGFALAGNAYRGVGIPFCVRSGEAAAELVAAQDPAGPK